MKSLLLTLILSLSLFHFGISQVGKVGINTTTPAAMLHVKDSSVVFTGPVPLPAVPGDPPISSAGNRMMWYAAKSAFRAGRVTGTEWNQGNIGTYSFATGFDCVASGMGSNSLGSECSATGAYSLAVGNYNIASGNGANSFGSDCSATGDYSFTAGGSNVATSFCSVALGVGCNSTNATAFTMGQENKASGAASFATGYKTQAKGLLSFSGGEETMAKSYACAVFGAFNDTTSSSSNTWSMGDPVFIIGNGTTNASRSNALTVLKNGKIGMGIANPGFPLNFPNTLGDKIALWGNSGPHYGLGVQNNLLQIHTDVIGSDIVFGYGTSAAFTERMRIKGNGNVGIANNNPAYKLDVGGRMRLRHSSDGSPGVWFNKSDNTIPIAFMGMLNDEYIGLYGEQGSAWNFLMSTITGRVGIGLQSPAQKLHVNGNGLFNGTVHAAKASSGATANGNAVGIVENNTSAYLNILAPSGNDSGILFGNPVSSAHGGIYYNPITVPNGLQFRVNGNLVRMALTDTGYLGLGTNTPISHLHVRSGNPGVSPAETGIATFENNGDAFINLSAPADNSSGIFFNHTAPAESAAILYNEGSVEDGFRFQLGTNTVAMVINDFGWVGIGTSNPTEQFHVVASAKVGGTVTASCGVLSCSDIRYKKNILPLTNVLSGIQSLSGVYYHWDKEKFPGIQFNDERQVGIIAQELEKVFPELVHTDADGYKTVDYSRLSPVLLEAVKEQQQIIEDQHSKIDHQQIQLDNQQREIDILTSRLDQLMEILITMKTTAGEPLVNSSEK